MAGLLILDDAPDVARSYVRCLKRHVPRILVAHDVAAAEAHLRGAEPPTMVLCDYLLGPDAPTGAEVLARWRAEFPFLTRAAIVTGSDLRTVPGADAVFGKPPDLDGLVRFFKT